MNDQNQISLKHQPQIFLSMKKKIEKVFFLNRQKSWKNINNFDYFS